MCQDVSGGIRLAFQLHGAAGDGGGLGDSGADQRPADIAGILLAVIAGVTDLKPVLIVGIQDLQGVALVQDLQHFGIGAGCASQPDPLAQHSAGVAGAGGEGGAEDQERGGDGNSGGTPQSAMDWDHEKPP